MITEPRFEHRAALPYVAIIAEVTIPEIPGVLPLLIPEVFNWLQSKRFVPAGAPFFHYLQIKGKDTKVAVGFPVVNPIAGDDRVHAGSFPAGQSIVFRYQGPYNKLYEAHTNLEKWAQDHHVMLQGPHTEFYLTDPVLETNPEKWQTDIVRMVKS